MVPSKRATWRTSAGGLCKSEHVTSVVLRGVCVCVCGRGQGSLLVALACHLPLPPGFACLDTRDPEQFGVLY